MATYHEINLTDAPFIADADLTAKQYYWVYPASTAGNVGVATGASNPTPLGILQNSPSAGQEARVRLIGPSKAYAYVNGTCILTVGNMVVAGSVGDTTSVTAYGTVNGRWLGPRATSGVVYGEVFIFGTSACAASA